MKYHIKKCSFGFTLAEVLITLGIIGVVAAMTLPSVIANHKKQVVLTRMRKFYSTINQALKLSEVDNGDPSYWVAPSQLDADSLYVFWNTYMIKYFTSKDVVKVADGISVKLADGSSFGVYCPGSYTTNGINCIHIVYCVDDKSCQKHLSTSGNKFYQYPLDGKNTFLFRAYNNNSIYTYGSTTYSSSYTRDDLLYSTSGSGYGCAARYKAYCAALIEYDGWKISDDYPVRF